MLLVEKFHSQTFKQAQVYAQNAPEHVWWPGSPDPLGELKRSPRSLAAMRGPTSKRKGRGDRGGKGRGRSGGEEKGEEGTRGMNGPTFWVKFMPL